MPTNPNLFTSLRADDQAKSIVEPGDVALLLKRDGSVQALNFGYDVSKLQTPEAQWSDDERAMQKQGARLFALAVAATHPQLMQILLDIAADPEIIDFEKLRSMTQVH